MRMQKKKTEALATAANKNLRDCVRVEIDHVSQTISCVWETSN